MYFKISDFFKKTIYNFLEKILWLKATGILFKTDSLFLRLPGAGSK